MKPGDVDAMTGAGGSFSGWNNQLRERYGSGTSDSGRCTALGKTNRNAAEVTTMLENQHIVSDRNQYRERLEGYLETVLQLGVSLQD